MVFNKSVIRGEIVNSEFVFCFWLVHSKSKGAAYFGLCRIFKNNLNKIQLITKSYNDWNNANQRFNWHENIQEHKN